MAFEVIDLNDLDVGDPLRRRILTRTKNSLDDLNSRVNAVEGGAAKVNVFNGTVLNAAQYNTSAELFIDQIRTDRAFTLTSAILTVLTAGTSGTLQFDVKKASTPAGPFVSVFNVKPSVVYTAGDNTESTNADFATVAVAEGDYLQLIVDSLQTPSRKFQVQVFGEVS